MQKASAHTPEYMIEQERQSVTHFTNLARIAKEQGGIDMQQTYMLCVEMSERKIKELRE